MKGKKTGGRTKGVTNKVDLAAREIYANIISNQTDNVELALEELATKDAFKYLLVMSKLMSYVMPKQIDIQSAGEPLQAPIIQLASTNGHT